MAPALDDTAAVEKAAQYAFDWSHPEIREYKYKMLEELCTNYDFDGLELDFMRFWHFFNPLRTTEAERKSILTDFVGSVRQWAVEVGDTVEAGQPVCIVEAMKMMNEVVAGEAGKVVEIAAENGEWVEFEQVLIYLEPTEA